MSALLITCSPCILIIAILGVVVQAIKCTITAIYGVIVGIILGISLFLAWLSDTLAILLKKLFLLVAIQLEKIGDRRRQRKDTEGEQQQSQDTQDLEAQIRAPKIAMVNQSQNQLEIGDEEPPQYRKYEDGDVIRLPPTAWTRKAL
ncbi:hypothetical protein G7Y79_00006g018130 [Physcia stellaris]|nr:hypothetical protein G7Y79_00006g018130 [Physcia stellaris]